MSLRSPTECEMEGPLPTVFPSARHSRARGNPDLFPTVRGRQGTELLSALGRGLVPGF
jgi:hypothetical protein